MENLCICVRFSPLMKNISKNNSKCCLEIVPLVTCIKNIEKIKWKQKKDKIEYIVPMYHKIIIKKLNPSEDAIKQYYSCVDLLPNLDLDTGDIYRVISDNIVLNKEKNDCMAPTLIAPLDIKFNQIMDNTSTNQKDQSNKSPISLNLSDPELISNKIMFEKFKTGSVQTENVEGEESILLQETDSATCYVNKSTSTILQNNEINSIKATISQKSLKSDFTRNSIVPVYDNIKPLITKDYSVHDNLKTIKKETSSIASAQQIDILKNNKINTRVNRTVQLFPYHIIHDSFDEEMIISNIRIQPEIRVAKFVEKMEKEIMPLKIILNNIIGKCSSLGLSNNTSHGIQREKNYNRVVYSIVLD